MGRGYEARLLVVSVHIISWKFHVPDISLLSLKNHEADAEVDAMFDMGEETMRLPLEEKMKYEQGDGGNNFG